MSAAGSSLGRCRFGGQRDKLAPSLCRLPGIESSRMRARNVSTCEDGGYGERSLNCSSFERQQSNAHVRGSSQTNEQAVQATVQQPHRAQNGASGHSPA